MSDYHIKLKPLADRIVVALHYTVPDENNSGGTNKRTLLDSLNEFTTEDAGATLVFESTVDIPKTANQAAIITAIETEWTRLQPAAVDIYDNQIDYYNIEGDLS